MKRLAAGIILLITLVVCVVVFLISRQSAAFRLDSEYYDNAQVEDVDITELRELVAKRKTFAVFAHQPGCQTSAELSQIVQDFSTQYQLEIYQTSFSDLKESGLVPELRFYPTFVIFHNGVVVDFLAADSEEDVPAYKTLDGFTEWFTNYVKL